MNPSTIVTERLVLTPLDVLDAVDMVSVLADESIYGYTGGEPPTLDALEDRYRRQVAGSATPEELWCNWIIRTAADHRAIGLIQATVTGSAADLAWIVAVGEQRTGVATEGTRAVHDWLAAHGVATFEAHIHPEHFASQRVAERLGLTTTGVFDDDGEEIWATGHAPAP